MNRQAYDVLVRVRDKIFTHRKRWTKGARAKDVRGGAVEPTDRAAARWCLLGAIERACSDSGQAAECAAINFVSESLPKRFDLITSFNDNPKTTITDVRKVLAKAIKLAEAA